MRILPVMQNYAAQPLKAPVFKSTERATKDANGNINSNYTYFFRDDLDWKAFARLLEKKYEGTDKVNVTCYGSSDGSEPLSLGIVLNEQMYKKARKFYPIIAKDKDDFVLDIAKRNRIKASFDDLDRIEHFSNRNQPSYFIIQNQKPVNNSMRIQPTYELKSKIKYQQADILEDIVNIPSENSVVLCRNLMPYIHNERDLTNLIDNLASRLKKNCLVVVGDSDHKVYAGKRLEDAGFVPTSVNNVYATRNRSLWS